MMPDRILQSRESSVVKERRLKRHIPDWRCSEFIAVIGIPRNLLQTEILVLTRSVECNVCNQRNDLRDADDVWSKIAEHLIGITRNLVALHASGGSKEQQRSLLLIVGERVLLSSRKLVD